MIQNRATGRLIPSGVSLASYEELRSLAGGWNFDWSAVRGSVVYKLTLDESPVAILGLMALAHREAHLEVTLLESRSDNVGSTKRPEGIAGTLLASAAELPFDSGFGGYLALESSRSSSNTTAEPTASPVSP